ncbi:hypothetical protein Aperf_G00000049529 [Anoplocephala perfoliata]
MQAQSVWSWAPGLIVELLKHEPRWCIRERDSKLTVEKLRNPQKDFTFATVRGSSVDMYFKSQVELDTIYRTMEGCNVDSIEEGIQAVKQGTLKAFIWDSARLNYEASRDCDLVTTGDVFGRVGYGLAMKKGNPWIYEISQAVLSFHERGFMEQLDTQWIFNSGESEKCVKTESSPATLELTNMAGVFIMVAVGIVVGLVLLLVEIACSRRKGIRARQIACARRASKRWRKRIEKKRRNPTSRNMKTSAVPAFVDECSKPVTTVSFPMLSNSSRVGNRLPQAVQISPIKTSDINNLVYQQPAENVSAKIQRVKTVEQKSSNLNTDTCFDDLVVVVVVVVVGSRAFKASADGIILMLSSWTHISE